MKIDLKYEEYKKDIIDICRIFPVDDPDFAKGGQVIIDENSIRLDKEYIFKNKLELKQILYAYLSKRYSYHSPWGLMTGTKPLKLFEKYANKNEIENLKKDYDISDEKFYLLEEIYRSHKKIAYDRKNIHLYINIPFCPSRCSYCSFPTIIYGNNDRRKEYVTYLIEEIKALSFEINKRNLRSIYIGGGTPSALTPDQIESLLTSLKANFDLEGLEEFTFEAGREDTLSEEKLDLLKEFGVSRISLNPQTFNLQSLQDVRRDFDFEHFKSMYEYAKKLGFIINMDLILGLSNENVKDIEITMDEVYGFMPDNLTIHTLSLKKGSRLSQTTSTTRDLSAGIEDMVFYSQERARDMGYKPYYLYRQKEILGNFENIGYCLSDKYSIYNIATNEEKESIVGLGMTANSKIFVGDKLEKYTNYKNIDEYINKLDLQVKNKIKILSKNSDK